MRGILSNFACRVRAAHRLCGELWKDEEQWVYGCPSVQPTVCTDATLSGPVPQAAQSLEAAALLVCADVQACKSCNNMSAAEMFTLRRPEHELRRTPATS